MSVRLTPAQAAKLGIGTPPATTRDRRQSRGPYHTRCTCGEEFRTIAAEDDHVSAGHNRFELILEAAP